jgi:hypothetical protein
MHCKLYRKRKYLLGDLVHYYIRITETALMGEGFEKLDLLKEKPYFP